MVACYTVRHLKGSSWWYMNGSTAKTKGQDIPLEFSCCIKKLPPTQKMLQNLIILYNLPLLFFFQAISNTRRRFSAYMDFVFMNCLIFSKNMFLYITFEHSPLLTAGMLVDWKQSWLVSLEITFRANCIGISIPELKSISHSWITCSATCSRKSNME